MQRHLLGIIALVFTVTGIALLIRGGVSGDKSTIAAVLLKVGPVLGVMWLAFPQLIQVVRRGPPWVIAAFVIGIGAMIYNKRTALVVIPVWLAIAALQFVGWLFNPLPKKDRPH